MKDSSYPKHYNSETFRYWYRKIQPEAVTSKVLALSKRAVEFFAADLNLVLPYPSIRWILPAEDLHDGARALSKALERELMTGQPFECDYFHVEVDISGYTRLDPENEIFVRADLDEALLILTIADEMRHIWQDKNFVKDYRRNDVNRADEEANDYSKEAVRRFADYLKG